MTATDLTLVTAADNGTLTTTSLIIAEGTGTQHKNVLELVRNNISDFEEFGRVAFETRPFETAGGIQHRDVAILNEEQATLLMTYMRNSRIVRDFKKRLVRAFFELRKRAAAAPALRGPELLAAAVLESQRVIEQRDARIHQLETQASTDAPKVAYVDMYVADSDLLSFSTVASTCEITEKALRELLIRKDWIYVQTDSRWSEGKGRKVERRRYSEKADKKRYFRRVETHDAPRFRGSELMHTLKMTPQGAEAIARLVAKERAA
ncbi:Rha family transcriptional regulator [Gordonia malaquae]|uniref:Rha family transcriptional regulator n=1 Tax=Gordonia malaquae TaxID=410332 RepID=UPI0030FEFE30